MRFQINGLPPSYNSHFRINYNMRNVYLTQEARFFKQRVKMSMPPMGFLPEDLFKIEITFYSNWFFKNNKPRRMDIQNLDKLLIDAVFEKLGADDSRLFNISLTKVQSLDNSLTTVNVSVLDTNKD